jgi:hypothetical protein
MRDKNKNKNSRPMGITLLAVLGFIVATFSLPFIIRTTSAFSTITGSYLQKMLIVVILQHAFLFTVLVIGSLGLLMGSKKGWYSAVLYLLIKMLGSILNLTIVLVSLFNDNFTNPGDPRGVAVSYLVSFLITVPIFYYLTRKESLTFFDIIKPNEKLILLAILGALYLGVSMFIHRTVL